MMQAHPITIQIECKRFCTWYQHAFKAVHLSRCAALSIQAIKMLSSLSSRLVTANKGTEADELDGLRAEVHRQLLDTNFLPASLQLANAAEVGVWSWSCKEPSSDMCPCLGKGE